MRFESPRSYLLHSLHCEKLILIQGALSEKAPCFFFPPHSFLLPHSLVAFQKIPDSKCRIFFKWPKLILRFFTVFQQLCLYWRLCVLSHLARTFCTLCTVKKLILIQGALSKKAPCFFPPHWFPLPHSLVAFQKIPDSKRTIYFKRPKLILRFFTVFQQLCLYLSSHSTWV